MAQVFTIFIESTGKVLRTGKMSSLGEAKKQVRPGEAILIGQVSGEFQKVVGGQLVDDPDARQAEADRDAVRKQIRGLRIAELQLIRNGVTDPAEAVKILARIMLSNV